MTDAIEHLLSFICHHYIFLVEYLLKSFAQLFIGLFSYSWVLRTLYIWIQILFQIFAIGFLCSCSDLQLVFSQSLALLFILFHSFNSIFQRAKMFNFDKVHFMLFFFFCIILRWKFFKINFYSIKVVKKQLSDGNVRIEVTFGEGVNFIIFWKSGAN